MRRPDPYPLMRQYAAPAFAKSAFWRVIVVFFVFEVVFNLTPFIYAAPADGSAPDATVGPVETLVEFAAFIIPCLAMLLAIRILHGRGLSSLIGPRDAAWRDLRRVGLAVGLVLLAFEPLRITSEWEYFGQMRDFGQWAIMLPFAFAVLLIQVGTEELYFRGYLQQQIAALNPSIWAWMVAPSIYFGLAHYINGFSTAESLIWTIWAASLGLACADLTARTGNLGAAIGLHLANNIFALTIVAVEGWPGSGLALFLYPPEEFGHAASPEATGLDVVALIDLAYSLAMIWVMWLAARVAVRR